MPLVPHFHIQPFDYCMSDKMIVKTADAMNGVGHKNVRP